MMEFTHVRRQITISSPGLHAKLLGEQRHAQAVEAWRARWEEPNLGVTIEFTQGAWDTEQEDGVRFEFDWPANDKLGSHLRWGTLVEEIADSFPECTLAHTTSFGVDFEEFDLGQTRRLRALGLGLVVKLMQDNT